MDYLKRTWAEVSLDAIKHNFNEIKNKVGGRAKICCVIKADGYGHGAVELSKLYEQLGADFFAVSNIDEGIEIREAGAKLPIVILGFTPANEAKRLSEYNISQAVYSLEYAKMLSQACCEQNVVCKIHIKVDTGMSRIGFMCQEFPRDDYSVEEIRTACTLKNLELEGMFTHFARADEYDRSPAMVQLERYLDFSRRVEEAGVEIPLHHCSNSAGIIRMPEANLNIVRAGITIYGIYPSSEVERDIVKLEPVMELKSHVTYVKDVPAGAAISYGGTYVADRKLRVATVPVGYADGYSRQLSNKGWVLIHGQKAPILGRVCMDQFMVDVTEIGDVKKGDEVTLIGRDGDEFIGIEEIGDLCGRFSYEFACDISPRVPRVYIKNGKEI